MSALWPRINVSLQAVAQILLVIGLGVWLSKRRNLDRQALAAVSNVNWHVLIPALMFSSIVGAVTPTGLLLLWPLLVLSLVHVVLGVVPALLLSWAARLPKDMCFFTVMAASLPNCGNLPWLFMPTMIRYFTPADQVTASIQYSTGLTSVYTITIVIITLIVPFVFKKPPETLVLPRNSSIVRLSTQDQRAGQEPQEEAELAAHAEQQHWQQQEDLHGQPCVQTQHQQQRQPGALQGATAWVVPVGPGTKTAHAAGTAAETLAKPFDVDSSRTAQHGEDRRHDRDQQQHLPSVRLAGICDHAAHAHMQAAPAPAGDDAHDGPPNRHFQGPFVYEPEAGDEHRSSYARQPSVGGADSFSSHRSSSFLLVHSRQLLGSFSRSMSRGLRRSASVVQLAWSFPTGWQPQQAAAHGAKQRTADSQPRWLQRCLSLWSSFLAHPVVNLPLGATLLGIACAAVGPVRGLLVNEMAPLHWLWLALSWVGMAAAPLATMQIGAELVQTAPTGASMRVTRRVQWTGNAIAIGVKLVVVPLINVALLRVAGLARLVPATDTVYQLLMLVEASVPAAVTLPVVCSRVYPDIRPLSSMLFWQYVASLFTLPAFLVWYLYMLEL